MLREALRNIRRRSVRTFLTVLGISIGIIALTVMGSLSEFINRMVQVTLEDARGVIQVEPKFALGPPGTGSISLESQEKIKTLPGVQRVIPFVVTVLGGIGGTVEEEQGFSGLVGFPPEDTVERFRNVELESGDFLQAGDSEGILLGHNLAVKYGLATGDRANFRGFDFTVRGVFKPYEGFFVNNSAVAPIETVRRVAILTPQAGVLNVIPRPGVDAEELANLISAEAGDVRVVSPKRAEENANRSLLIFSAMVLGLAIVSLVVGGVATVNTMIMAISERTREIGLKKAVGAPDRAILMEYVTEATVIGFIAGVTGLAIGIAAAFFLNRLTSSEFGLEIFRITFRLSLFAVLFASILGALAGFFPALRAARLDPVKALRTG